MPKEVLVKKGYIEDLAAQRKALQSRIAELEKAKEPSDAALAALTTQLEAEKDAKATLESLLATANRAVKEERLKNEEERVKKEELRAEVELLHGEKNKEIARLKAEVKDRESLRAEVQRLSTANADLSARDLDTRAIRERLKKKSEELEVAYRRIRELGEEVQALRNALRAATVAPDGFKSAEIPSPTLEEGADSSAPFDDCVLGSVPAA